MKELRERERSEAIASASAEHAAAEGRLASLRGILAARNQGPYDWQTAWASKGDFRPTGFHKPVPIFSMSSCKAAAARNLPIGPWIVFYAFCGALAILFGSSGIRLMAIPYFALVASWLVSTVKTRSALARTDFQNKSLEFENDLSGLTADYNVAQEKERAAWIEDDAARERVRDAIAKSDLEAIVSVLESELQNESLPIPLVFELELDTTENAKIEVTLPDLDDVPAQVTSLTQRGKLSTKAMSQKDRTDIFADLCAALCLRLIYEAYRVVPSLARIEVFGRTSGIDPATGHPHEFIALHVDTTRVALDSLNLGHVDPSSALNTLGGRLSYDRRGILTPLEGVVGITPSD